MNQSNKKNKEFIKNVGVNYFLQESPKNWFEKNTNFEQEETNIANINKLNKIKNIIENIRKYPSELKKSANNLVVFDGSLNAKVIFVGEAPGKEEDEQGLPFVGRAGQLLNKMLKAINLKREEVYITNVVNWRPPNNRTPTDREILEFLPFLQQQIDTINPNYLFLLGNVATKAILSSPLSLAKLRGKWHEYESLKLNKKIYTIASYHPAFLLRSPQHKKASWEDLQMLQKKLKNEE